MIDTLILIELAYAMLVYILRSSYFSAFFHNYEKPTQSSETPAKTNIATAKNPLTKKKLVSQRLEQLVHHEWCC